MSGGLGGFRSGVGFFFAGLDLLRRERGLWGLASVPVLFALVAVLGVTVAFGLNLAEIHSAWASLLPILEVEQAWQWLWVGPARAVLFVVAALATLLTLAFGLIAALLLANLLSAPFVDVLSQRVEQIECGAAASPASGESVWRDALRSFRAELERVAFLLGVWLVVSAIGLVVPGAQLFTGPLLIGVAIVFLPLDYAGFALDRRGVRFADRRRWLRAHLATMLGFGGAAFVACMVPIANLLVLPTLVAAGTLLVVRMPPSSASEATR